MNYFKDFVEGVAKGFVASVSERSDDLSANDVVAASPMISPSTWWSSPGIGVACSRRKCSNRARHVVLQGSADFDAALAE